MRAVLHTLVVCKGLEVCRHGQIINHRCVIFNFCANAFQIYVFRKACRCSTFQYDSELQNSQKALPSTTSYYKAWTKYFPVLLCTTKLAKSTSQYYFVLQSTSQYYFALQSSQKSTSQYYFVLQDSQKALPNTTSYYKTRKKHVPVLLRTTKLAQSTSQYYFVQQSLHESTSKYYFLLPVVLHKAVSESTDGPKGGWSCVFWSGCNDCSGHLVGHLIHNCCM